MSYNTTGRLLRLTTWGESHGPAIGAVIDGCPPNIPIKASEIQYWLDQRKPGQNKFTTQRKEEDKVEILSGVFEGLSTGTPIQLLIANKDQRSKDYSDIKGTFRPGHADLTYWHKYRNRDYRGGGRASARETAARVAGGSIARSILNSICPNIKIKGYLIQMGEHKIVRDNFDYDAIGKNAFWCPDAKIADIWSDYLIEIRKSGDSIGAMIEVCAQNVPPGLGAPIYAKIDGDLASAMMSINAAKSVEIGDGTNVASLRGSQNSDEFFLENDKLAFKSNHSGGILGGITTGQDIICRVAIKPASSILIPKEAVTLKGVATEVVTKGRHDPCVGIRGVPVAEAMMALTLADHVLLHRAQCGAIKNYQF